MSARVLLLAPLLALAALASASPVPDTCEDPCRIVGHSFAYVAPVAKVTSGDSVVWGSLDTTHVNGDGSGSGAGATCFAVSGSVVEDSEPVRLDIVDGALLATVGLTTLECTTAELLDDGSFALPYHCLLHPIMRGVLVVAPAEA